MGVASDCPCHADSFVVLILILISCDRRSDRPFLWQEAKPEVPAASTPKLDAVEAPEDENFEEVEEAEVDLEQTGESKASAARFVAFSWRFTEYISDICRYL